MTLNSTFRIGLLLLTFHCIHFLSICDASLQRPENSIVHMLLDVISSQCSNLILVIVVNQGRAVNPSFVAYFYQCKSGTEVCTYAYQLLMYLYMYVNAYIYVCVCVYECMRFVFFFILWICVEL